MDDVAEQLGENRTSLLRRLVAAERNRIGADQNDAERLASALIDEYGPDALLRVTPPGATQLTQAASVLLLAGGWAGDWDEAVVYAALLVEAWPETDGRVTLVLRGSHEREMAIPLATVPAVNGADLVLSLRALRDLIARGSAQAPPDEQP
jgi:hypothetical protein